MHSNSKETFSELPPELLAAAEDGDFRAVKKGLIENPKSVNLSEPEFGWTMLHRAARFGHDRLVALLLRAGSNPNLCDKGQSTPLHDAATGHEHTLASMVLLVEAGAKLEVLNAWLQSPLHVCAFYSNWPGFIYLLGKGANPWLKDSENENALEAAKTQLASVNPERRYARQRKELRMMINILSCLDSDASSLPHRP